MKVCLISSNAARGARPVASGCDVYRLRSHNTRKPDGHLDGSVRTRSRSFRSRPHPSLSALLELWTRCRLGSRINLSSPQTHIQTRTYKIESPAEKTRPSTHARTQYTYTYAVHRAISVRGPSRSRLLAIELPGYTVTLRAKRWGHGQRPASREPRVAGGR